MFTGIIEETGILVSSARGPRSCVLNIRARAVLDGTGPGDSIAVNGVCLTAATVSPTGFTADVMPETLARTGLGSMKPGALVNLERAMACLLYTSADDLGCQRNNGYACHLADIGHGT